MSPNAHAPSKAPKGIRRVQFASVGRLGFWSKSGSFPAQQLETTRKLLRVLWLVGLLVGWLAGLVSVCFGCIPLFLSPGCPPEKSHDHPRSSNVPNRRIRAWALTAEAPKKGRVVFFLQKQGSKQKLFFKTLIVFPQLLLPPSTTHLDVLLGQQHLIKRFFN